VSGIELYLVIGLCWATVRMGLAVLAAIFSNRFAMDGGLDKSHPAILVFNFCMYALFWPIAAPWFIGHCGLLIVSGLGEVWSSWRTAKLLAKAEES
jgi:hypothetical protein